MVTNNPAKNLYERQGYKVMSEETCCGCLRCAAGVRVRTIIIIKVQFSPVIALRLELMKTHSIYMINTCILKIMFIFSILLKEIIPLNKLILMIIVFLRFLVVIFTNNKTWFPRYVPAVIVDKTNQAPRL